MLRLYRKPKHTLLLHNCSIKKCIISSFRTRLRIWRPKRGIWRFIACYRIFLISTFPSLPTFPSNHLTRQTWRVFMNNQRFRQNKRMSLSDWNVKCYMLYDLVYLLREYDDNFTLSIGRLNNGNYKEMKNKNRACSLAFMLFTEIIGN